MSVLNQSGEEPVECPLCMEPLEVDDLNFFPCTCGYQVCISGDRRLLYFLYRLGPEMPKKFCDNPLPPPEKILKISYYLLKFP